MRAQELYNSYCRKQITEADFLYHMRRDQMLKEFISPVNNTQDIITILKNRGQITQQVTEDQLIKETPDEDEHGETFPNDPEYGEKLDEEEKINQPDYKYYTCQIFQDGTLNICEGFEDESDAKDNKRELESYMEDNFIMKVLSKRFLSSKGINPDDNKYWHDPQSDGTKGGTGKLSSKKDNNISEVKKPKLTADQVNYYEFTRGWREELNGTDDIDKAKEKALKNLATDPAYYTNKLDQETKAKMVVDKKDNKEKILKAPTDQIEVKDRENQMKDAKKKDPVKSNVKTNLGNQEKAKGMPKGVKVMKLKEGIKNIIKENDAYNQHLEVLRGMTKMVPEELAKAVLDGHLPMSGLRAEFAAKVLGKHVADGNKSPEVTKAFQKLSDKHLNEGTEYDDHINNKDKIKSVTDHFIKLAGGSKEKAVQLVTKHIKDAEKSPHKIALETLVKVYKKVLNSLIGTKDVKANASTFSTNEHDMKRPCPSANDARSRIHSTWNGKDPKDYNGIDETQDIEALRQSVLKGLEKALKCDNKVAEKIYSHYEKDFFSKNLQSGKSPEVIVKAFVKGLKKPKNEEFEGNVGPQEADWVDTELEEKKKTVSKVHPVEGAMHKLLGLKPEETVASKYKDGASLYNALARKVKDHKKLTGMLAYAANINKKQDVFDAALHHSKKVNGSKKDLNESEDRKKIYQKAFVSIDKAIKSGNEYLSKKKIK